MTTAKQWWALIGLSLGGFITSLDFTIINTALPTIQRSLTLSTVELQWVMNIFVLGICLFSVTAGRFGDIFGQRTLLFIGMFIFIISCLYAGFSTHAWSLIISRAFQGIGIAIIIPTAMALIVSTYPPNKSHRNIGIWTAIRGVGMAVGPVVGGIIAARFDWHWIFLVNVPVIIISFIICLFSLDNPPFKKEVIDWFGFLLLSVSVASLTIVFIKMPDWGLISIPSISLLVLAFISFIVLYVHEQHFIHPALAFDLFQNSTFFCSAIVNFMTLFFAYTVFFLAPLYLENVHNLSPEIVGFMLLPVGICMIIISMSADYLTRYISIKKMILASLILFIFSAALQILFKPLSELTFIEVVLTIMAFAWGMMGVAWGTANVFSISVAVSQLPKKHSGAVSGTLTTIRNIGATLGLAITISIFRYVDRHALNKLLTLANIHFTERQQHVLRAYLSDPDQIQTALSQLGHPLSLFLLFRAAFMDGYIAAMATLLLISIAVFLIVFYLIRRKKAFKNL